MEKMKRYIECYVPVTSCSLRCHYCYITQHRLFSKKLPHFDYPPEYVAKALSKERLGGTCLINMCGAGETLLPPEMPAYIKALLEEGHYVMIVTNGTASKRFDEISLFPRELLKRLVFKFSFQYLELKERKLMDVFFDNIYKVYRAGCSFTLEITPCDEFILHIEDIKAECLKRVGALCHITVARDERMKTFPILSEYPIKEYRKVWGIFDSPLFDFKLSVWGKKRKEYCYCGDWSFNLNLGTGDMGQCYWSWTKYNIYKDLSLPIPFNAIGKLCRESHCHNVHSFLTLGVIPTLQTPSYTEVRNRICKNGTEWLYPEMKEFLSCKLVMTNELYSDSQKRKAAFVSYWHAVCRIPARLVKRTIGSKT